jgi:uncharacterized protein
MPRKRATKTATSAAPAHVPTPGLYGWITHTELASDDPVATKTWCAAMFGWTFKPSMPSPNGEYHLFAFSETGGGGIRQTHATETPSSMPVVHVADAKAAFDKALSEGAHEIMPPTRVMEGVTVAVIRAPGGVPIGLSGP